MTSARNVLLGWLGVPVPPIPKQRNRTRLAYRKTAQRRHSYRSASAREMFAIVKSEPPDRDPLQAAVVAEVRAFGFVNTADPPTPAD